MDYSAPCNDPRETESEHSEEVIEVLDHPKSADLEVVVPLTGPVPRIMRCSRRNVLTLNVTYARRRRKRDGLFLNLFNPLKKLVLENPGFLAERFDVNKILADAQNFSSSGYSLVNEELQKKLLKLEQSKREEAERQAWLASQGIEEGGSFGEAIGTELQGLGTELQAAASQASPSSARKSSSKR